MLYGCGCVPRERAAATHSGRSSAIHHALSPNTAATRCGAPNLELSCRKAIFARPSAAGRFACDREYRLNTSDFGTLLPHRAVRLRIRPRVWPGEPTDTKCRKIQSPVFRAAAVRRRELTPERVVSTKCARPTETAACSRLSAVRSACAGLAISMSAVVASGSIFLNPSKPQFRVNVELPLRFGPATTNCVGIDAVSGGVSWTPPAAS